MAAATFILANGGAIAGAPWGGGEADGEMESRARLPQVLDDGSPVVVSSHEGGGGGRRGIGLRSRR